jgi:hypothetical protein
MWTILIKPMPVREPGPPGQKRHSIAILLELTME